MGSLIIALLWMLLAIVLIAGVFMAVLWVLRYIGLPIPPQVDKFGLLIIALLALIWLVTIVLGGSPPFSGFKMGSSAFPPPVHILDHAHRV
jgi:hypothetical protein